MKRVRGVSKTENNQGVPGGAPLNQHKRYLPLKKGEHTLIIVLEPLADEPEIIWGFGIGVQSRILTGIFQ